MSPDEIRFRDLHEVLGVSTASAARYARRRGFPKPKKIAGIRFWSRREVKAWAKKNPPGPGGRPKTD